ncbi:RNA dependent RNA polymerase-domain-containing protein [Gaertneriomyces semiglobifer]|nr:RNA dependent RNA polymerase-domain-containing protein [Gaertneriomyces semiglobifer]
MYNRSYHPPRGTSHSSKEVSALTSCENDCHRKLRAFCAEVSIKFSELVTIEEYNLLFATIQRCQQDLPRVSQCIDDFLECMRIEFEMEPTVLRNKVFMRGKFHEFLKRCEPRAVFGQPASPYAAQPRSTDQMHRTIASVSTIGHSRVSSYYPMKKESRPSHHPSIKSQPSISPVPPRGLTRQSSFVEECPRKRDSIIDGTMSPSQPHPKRRSPHNRQVSMLSLDRAPSVFENFDSEPLPQDTKCIRTTQRTYTDVIPAPSYLQNMLHELDFPLRYEVYRHMAFDGPLEWEHLTAADVEKLQSCSDVHEVYATLLAVRKGLITSSGRREPSDKSFRGPAPPPSSLDVYAYKVNVDLHKKEAGVPTYALAAASGTRSFRAARAFGDHRFISVRFPSNKSHLGLRQLKEKTRTLALCGREYELVQEKSGVAARYFATKCLHCEFLQCDRPCIRPISVDEFIQWHYPLSCPQNSKLQWSKFVARIDLAFSSTLAGYVLKPDDKHVYIDDLWTVDEQGETHYLTDGCGLVSWEVLRTVWERLGLTSVPCAVQGKEHGWMVSSCLPMA